MPKPKPTAIYRSLLSDAFRVARERKALWVFGLFAAILSTGGAWEMTAKSLHRLSALQLACAEAVRGTFGGTRMFGEIVQATLRQDPSFLNLLLTVGSATVIGSIIASVISQGALIASVGARKISDSEAALAGTRSFWDLLALNLLHKAAHVVLVLLASVPFLALVARPEAGAILSAFLTLVLIVPASIAVSTLFMLASVDAVKKKTHTLDAIHHAVRAWRAHWVAALELGVILFLAAVLAATLYILAAAILAVPAAVAFSAALAAESAAVSIVTGTICISLFFLLLFAFVGITNVFQYAAWTRFYDLATAKKKIISKTHRVWRGR